MKTISIPYYTSTLDLHVDEANLKAVVTAKMHEYKAGKTEVELVHEALEHPIASPRLRDLAKGKQKVVLVTSDHTRAVPSKITLPILLDEIRQGNPDADITILIATGLHRPTTEEEQRRMFGDATASIFIPAFVEPMLTLEQSLSVTARAAGMLRISSSSPFALSRVLAYFMGSPPADANIIDTGVTDIRLLIIGTPYSFSISSPVLTRFSALRHILS